MSTKKTFTERFHPTGLTVIVCLIALLAFDAVDQWNWLPGVVKLQIGIALCASLWSFLRYWSDKRAAGLQKWRTPESELLVIDLIGGWPGALLAQRLFRHKTAKRSFRAKFIFVTALNILASVVLLWLVTRPDPTVTLP